MSIIFPSIIILKTSVELFVSQPFFLHCSTINPLEVCTANGCGGYHHLSMCKYFQHHFVCLMIRVHTRTRTCCNITINIIICRHKNNMLKYFDRIFHWIFAKCLVGESR